MKVQTLASIGLCTEAGTCVLCCRVALDAYAARDAAMQQALRESDERLKAMYTRMAHGQM